MLVRARSYGSRSITVMRGPQSVQVMNGYMKRRLPGSSNSACARVAQRHVGGHRRRGGRLVATLEDGKVVSAARRSRLRSHAVNPGQRWGLSPQLRGELLQVARRALDLDLDRLRRCCEPSPRARGGARAGPRTGGNPRPALRPSRQVTGGECRRVPPGHADRVDAIRCRRKLYHWSMPCAGERRCPENA